MTINLAELLADREAGTDGPWYVNEPNKEEERYVGEMIIGAGIRTVREPTLHDNRFREVRYSEHVVDGCGCCGSPWGNDEHAEADARRIARLPDLEAAYIEAVRALREMKGLLSYAGQDACNEAVAQGNKNKAWHIAHKFLGDGE